MDHPNIVRMYEFYDEEENYCIVTGLCDGGELFDTIIKSGKLTEHNARLLIKSLLSCINYCHLNGVVHRDLKPENILLECDLDMNKMKIIDFGNAAHFNKDCGQDHNYFKDILGTPYYIAPEVLN